MSIDLLAREMFLRNKIFLAVISKASAVVKILAKRLYLTSLLRGI